MSVASAKAPYIALAKAHENVTWNNLNRHRVTCEAWRGGEQPCLICRNVFDEWNIARQRLDELSK